MPMQEAEWLRWRGAARRRQAGPVAPVASAAPQAAGVTTQV